MIEAMACGTPVLAFNRGSVSEIIEDGKTGIVVQSKDEAIKKVTPSSGFGQTENPARVRAAFFGSTNGP